MAFDESFDALILYLFMSQNVSCCFTLGTALCGVQYMCFTAATGTLHGGTFLLFIANINIFIFPVFSEPISPQNIVPALLQP